MASSPSLPAARDLERAGQRACPSPRSTRGSGASSRPPGSPAPGPDGPAPRTSSKEPSSATSRSFGRGRPRRPAGRGRPSPRAVRCSRRTAWRRCPGQHVFRVTADGGEAVVGELERVVEVQNRGKSGSWRRDARATRAARARRGGPCHPPCQRTGMACAGSRGPHAARPVLRTIPTRCGPETVETSDVEGEATGDPQRLARDERRVVGAEVQHRVHDVAHLAAVGG